MGPFQHNIRKLRKAYRGATPERQRAIHAAALSNETCHKNRKVKGALGKIIPPMEADMKAAGVEPVQTIFD